MKRRFHGRGRCPFETYEPDKKINVSREHAIPFLVRVGNFFSLLGGTTAFVISGFFVAIKGCLGLKTQVRKLDPRKQKVVEFKDKRYAVLRDY